MSSPQYQQQRQRLLPPTKLQFLVLGAAGAGKTSILRRYFYKTFQAGSRVPTLGSDFYTGRVPHPGGPSPTTTPDDSDTTEQPQPQPSQQQEQAVEIRLQMWDTPGRERSASKNRRRTLRYETSLSDSFFRQADAIMLVYDMTSSTSFTQLLVWYADLMELNKTIKESNSKRGILPIVIVANKLDIFQSDKDRAPHYPQHAREQRDVLGLSGDFRGNDFRYEYRVSPVNAQTELRSSTSSSSNNRMEISSFLANRENWTTDGSYLDSVRLLE
jgi:GTPase SAR1 family protein